MNKPFTPDEGFYLYNDPSVHTASICRKVSKSQFLSIFNKIRSQFAFKLTAYSEKMKIFFQNYDASYTDPNSTMDGKVFPEVNVTHGISFQLSYRKFCEEPYGYNEFNWLTLKINPRLFVDSHSREFIFDDYDFANVSCRDIDFWKEFDKYYCEFLKEWDLDYSFKIGNLKRTDVAGTIIVPDDFDKPKYIDYLSRMPRSVIFKEANFSDDEQSAHQSLALTKNRELTFYDKNFEQKKRFKNDCIYELLRAEYRISESELNKIISTFFPEITINENTKIWYKLYLISNLSTLVLLKAISTIYPSGDILELNRAKKRIEKPKRWCGYNLHKSTREDLKFIISAFSKATSFEDIRALDARFRYIFGEWKYYRLLGLLDDLQISPLSLPRPKRNACGSVTRMPGPKALFMSAIMNSPEKNYLSIDPDLLKFFEKYPSLDELMNTLN